MQAQHLIRMLDHACSKGLPLIEEQPVGQLGIAHRIVPRGRAEAVVLDQAVVRVLREGDRRELERVDQRQPMQGQAGVQQGKGRSIEGNDVVTQREARAMGERVDTRYQIGCPSGDPRAGVQIRAVEPDLAQTERILLGRLDVEAQTGDGWAIRGCGHPRRVVVRSGEPTS